MKKIGQGGPRSARDLRSPPNALVLEALSKYVLPERIDEALRQTGHWPKRIRKLPAWAVVWLVVAIGLWGDLDIPAIWCQVAGMLAVLLEGAGGQHPPSKGALSKARTRLGPRPLRRLFTMTAQVTTQSPPRGTFYKNKRLLLIDGQKLPVPDTPANAKAFGRPSTRRNGQAMAGGYPQVSTVRLVEAGTRLTVAAVLKPATSAEYPHASNLLKHTHPGDLILWDCGYYGFSLLKQAVDTKRDVLGPVPAKVIMERIQTLPDGSYLARIYPTTYARHHHQQGLTVRVLEYTLDDPRRPGCGERHRLVTTLLDHRTHPALELIALYHQRWEIEIANDEITTHQLNRPVTFRSRTPCGVVQEFYGILLAHNAVRALMLQAALTVDIDPRTLSFMHAIRIIRHAIPQMRAAPTAQLPHLYQALIQFIARGRLPPRDNRINPRVVKIKISNFQKKKPQHLHGLQPQRSFMAAVVMLK